MWWHADLPTEPPAAAPEPAPELSAPGDFLLEWILPTLAGEALADQVDEPDADGSVRRLVRRRMRGSPADL
jgi:hypothetical protein